MCYFSSCVQIALYYYYYECVCYGCAMSEGGSGDVHVPAVKQLCRELRGCVHSVKSQRCQRMLFLCGSRRNILHLQKKKLKDVFLKVSLEDFSLHS